MEAEIFRPNLMSITQVQADDDHHQKYHGKQWQQQWYRHIHTIKKINSREDKSEAVCRTTVNTSID